MGCRHYFADRFEDLVDEGESRSSSRIREHENFRLVSQLHLASQTPWSRCSLSSRCVVAPFWLDLRLRFRLCLCLYLNVQQTNWYSRSQVRNVCRFPEHSNGTFVLSLQVALFCEIGFRFGWVGWERSACRATSEPNSFIQWCFKEIFGGGRGDSYTFSFMISPVSILQHLSGFNRLGVFREGWWRSIASDRTLIPSLEQVWCRPNTQCFDVSSMLYAGIVHDAVLPSRLCQDPYGLSIGSTSRKNTVCLLLKFCPPGINPELMMECKLITHPTWYMYWKSCSELPHCPVVRDQWDCVLNDLEELGDKECRVLKNQYNTEIFPWYLSLLPLYSSTFHQTNVGNAQNGSEDDLLISRIQSLHHLLEVDYHDEEDGSVSSTLDNRWKNNLVVQYRSKFCPNGYSFCVGVGFVRRPHLLAGGVHSVTTCPRGSGRAAGTAGNWRRVRRVGSWRWNGELKIEEWRSASCMDELSANTPTTWATRCGVQWVKYDDNTN